MPSKSKAQADFMRAAAHNADFAKKVGIGQPVAREFVAHDQALGKQAMAKKPERKK